MHPQRKLHSLSELNRLLPESEKQSPSKHVHDGRGRTVHVVLDTKGRKGKRVTLVSGLQHNPTTLEDIARILKHHCGAGGTVKDGNIEIQGDQRVRASEKLRAMNYIVK